jgi:hypothetical protein
MASTTFGSGVVLSNGFLSHLMGGQGGSSGFAGSAALESLVASAQAPSVGTRKKSGRQRIPKTVDSSTLLIEFDCQGEDSDSDVYDVSLDYIFGSNEYYGLQANETAPFEDMVGVFLNGEAPADNSATVEGKIVSANNIRVGSQYHIQYQLDGHDGILEGYAYWQDYEKYGQRDSNNDCRYGRCHVQLVHFHL